MVVLDDKTLEMKMKRSDRKHLGKKPHHDEESAEREADRLRQFSSRYKSYKCPSCDFFHVGRRKLQ